MLMDKGYSFRLKIVRAGFYLLSIGGLLAIFAGLLWLTWNNYIEDNWEYRHLSFLESVGLVSIAYVFYSAVKFSALRENYQENELGSPMHPKNSENPTSNSKNTSNSNTSCSHSELSASEREQLKRQLEPFCGKSVSRSHLH
jgi:hypothetical protein